MRLNNQIQKTGVIILFLSAITFILFSSIKDLGSDEYIRIEAENAGYVTPPLYVEPNEDASGGKVIVCRGLHLSNSGIAKYSISVKKEGKYYFWGKCYWKDACANQFRVQNNNRQYGFGDDPVYGRWHWVNGPTLTFNRGINEVFLLSHDQDAQMDELLLTMDPEYVPFDKQREVYFLDFEDSLKNKLQISNTANWRIVKNTTSSVCILVTPKENKEIALLDKTNSKDDFIFQVIAKPIELQSQLLVILDFINDQDYRFISIDRKTVHYCHFNNGQADLIYEKEGNFLNNEFNNIALAKTNGYLKLKIEGKTVFDIPTNSEMKGKAGIGASGGNILLDNIAYYFPTSFVQEENFHDKVDYGHWFYRERPEKTIKPFDKMKIGYNDWWIVSGKWERMRDSTEEDIRGIMDIRTSIDKPAVLVLGNDFWKNYTFSAAIKVKDDSGFGICTYFQDSLNYYSFRWVHDKTGHYNRQLLKMEDGTEKILASDSEPFVVDTWYDMGMSLFKDKITATVNSMPVLMATDSTFSEGKLGFWTNSLQNAQFDDVKISISDSISRINNLRDYDFIFGSGSPIARCLSDWEPISQSNIHLHPQLLKCCVSKKTFEDVMLYNLNTLNGNFKIEVDVDNIPQDINAVFEFTSQSKDTAIYKFVILNDGIILLRNGKVLISNPKHYDRKKIEIYRRNNEWAIEFDGKKAFAGRYQMETGTWKVAIGYSGIGKGQIFLNKIIIEDHLKNN